MRKDSFYALLALFGVGLAVWYLFKKNGVVGNPPDNVLQPPQTITPQVTEKNTVSVPMISVRPQMLPSTSASVTPVVHREQS